jgi:membrane associated rhomboid family serine protease
MKNNTNSNIQWGKFAGLAGQWAIVLTLLIFLGKFIDQELERVSPLFLWILPSLFIVFSLFKIVRDTQLKSKK